MTGDAVIQQLSKRRKRYLEENSMADTGFSPCVTDGFGTPATGPKSTPVRIMCPKCALICVRILTCLLEEAQDQWHEHEAGDAG